MGCRIQRDGQLGQHRFPPEDRIVAFLAPPWADALSAENGLDLGHTKPPIAEVVDDFEHAYPDRPFLYVVEVRERLVPGPLAELRDRFDWSEISIYEIAGPTGRHGVLFGTKRWPFDRADQKMPLSQSLPQIQVFLPLDIVQAAVLWEPVAK